MPKVLSSHRIWLGRVRELGTLEGGLDELMAGRGGVYVITGEPGIGKTRLADEVCRAAAARGASSHWGHAWEAGGAPTYWPIVQALRSMSPDGAALAGLVTPSRAPSDRFQLFEAIDAFLAAATRTPRIMVLDDLHAADPSSLQLLHHIVRDLRARPLMVIGTYREAEARLTPELRPLLARLAREACVLPLGPLARSEVAQFVTQATGGAPSEERIDELYAQTEGNPLFLRELLQLGGVEPGRSEGIREVVRARLALMPPGSRPVLEAAAVLGREFTAAPLAAVTGVAELEVRALLEPAADAAIVEPLVRPPRWRFTHVLLRQGLYDDCPAERRAAVHRAAARELARRPGEPPLAEIAHHLVHAIPAVPPIEAAHAALRAADRAMRLLAFEDALALYTNAERLLGDAAGEEGARFDATLGVGLACMGMAEVDRGKQACGRAAALARELGDGARFARAVLGAGYEHAPWSRDAAAIRQLEEALAALPPGDGALRARCMAQLAVDRLPEPDTRPITALAHDAVAMARRIGDPETLRLTLSAASLAMELYADPADRRAVNQEVLRLALAAGDKRLALRAHTFLGGDAWELGDPESARPHVVAMEGLVREFRHGRFGWVVPLFRLTEALAQGRFEDARGAYEEARATTREDQARGWILAAAPLTIACVTERYEDRAGVESAVRAAFGAMGHELGGCVGEMLIAQLHGRAGDGRRARAQLETVAAHPLFGAVEEPSWLAALVDACHLASDTALADRLYRALRPHAHRFAWLGPLGACVDLPYTRHLGLLAGPLGRLDDAVAHLEDAQARAASAGMRGVLARLGWELARALRARDRAGDRARAVDIAAAARALATELGQAGLLPALEALALERLGGAAMATDAKAAPPPRLSLRRDGDVWFVEWGERSLRLRDTRGVSLLAQLVAHRGQELHVLQLVSAGDGPRDQGDAGPALDATAVRRYRQRLLDLREELVEAERFADVGRAVKARAETDFLARELARAVGLGGRERRVGRAAERARTTVQKRLREAIRRIHDELPDLGRHLDQTIRTGTFCGYLPDGRPR